MNRISDAYAFAREGRHLEGQVPVVDLERLQDVVSDSAGDLAYRVDGRKGARGELMLHVQVTGSLALTCQRCLEGIPFALEVDSFLELVPESGDLTQDELEDDTRDFLPVAGELNVIELIEDEVLLAVPFAPRHENCGLPGEAEAGERQGPFAGLASLKGKLN